MRLKSTARDYYHNFTLSSFLRLSELRVRMDFDFNNYELLDAAIFWFTNQERGKHGLSPLAFHPKLRQMARLHSSQMSKHHFFSHDNLYETQYKTLSNRLDSVKDQCFDGFMTFGENIALIATLEGSDSFYVRTTGGKHHFYDKNDHELIFLDCAEYAHLVVEGWMNSPGHRANILNTSFEYLGCGCELLLKKNDSIPYFNLTQNFGGGLIPATATDIRSTCNPRTTNSNTDNNSKKALFGGWGLNQNSITMNEDFMNGDVMPGGYSPENGEEKTLCVFLLDNSGSMSAPAAAGSSQTRIDALNEGLVQFYNDILNDEVLSQKVEVAVISFESTVCYLQQPALVQDFTMPTLQAMGGTDMCSGVQKAIEVVEERKKYWMSHGIAYKRPWIILISDGGANVDSVKEQAKQGAVQKHFFIQPIGVGDSADMNVLNSLATNTALKLGDGKFSEFFKWLSNSIGTIATADGPNVQLENPFDTYAV